LRFMFVCFLMIMISGCISQPVYQDNMKNDTHDKYVYTNSTDDIIKEKIRSNLIGTEIVYSDFSGKKVVYNVTDTDIKSIEKTLINGNIAWKVRIGEDMAWDYYYEESGDKIIKTEQLFQT
jgi:hypothetical protein